MSGSQVGGHAGKKRKKQFYKAISKKRCGHVLQPGMKGVLITCNQNERHCVREAYNILNEYADKLYGEQNAKSEEQSFEEELRSLQESGKSGYRFHQADTKTKNHIFIESQVDDPCHLVHSMLKDVKETQRQVGRHVLRIIPVTLTCKGHIEKIEKAASDLLDSFVSNSGTKSDEPPVTFTVLAKVKNNSAVKKEDIVRTFLNLIRLKEINWKPQLVDSDLIIYVEVLQTVCCMSILKDYFQFKKYNLIEVAKPLKENSSDNDNQEIKAENGAAIKDVD